MRLSPVLFSFWKTACLLFKPFGLRNMQLKFTPQTVLERLSFPSFFVFPWKEKKKNRLSSPGTFPTANKFQRQCAIAHGSVWVLSMRFFIQNIQEKATGKKVVQVEFVAAKCTQEVYIRGNILQSLRCIPSPHIFGRISDAPAEFIIVRPSKSLFNGTKPLDLNPLASKLIGASWQRAPSTCASIAAFKLSLFPRLTPLDTAFWKKKEKIISILNDFFSEEKKSDKMALACALIKNVAKHFSCSLQVTMVDKPGKRITVITKKINSRVLTFTLQQNSCLSLHRVWVSRPAV